MKSALLFGLFFIPFLAMPTEKARPIHPFLSADGKLLTPSENRSTQEVPERIKNAFVALFEQCIVQNKPTPEEFNKLAPQQKEELIKNLTQHCTNLVIITIYRACEAGRFTEEECSKVFKNFKRKEEKSEPDHRVDNSPRREGK